MQWNKEIKSWFASANKQDWYCVLRNIAPEPVNGSIKRSAGGKSLIICARQRYLLPGHFRKGFMLTFLGFPVNELLPNLMIDASNC